MRNNLGKTSIAALYFLKDFLCICSWRWPVWLAGASPVRIFWEDGFSLPGGGALGCASGRFGLGTAAHMTCQRGRGGDVAQSCLLFLEMGESRGGEDE